jgi:hypothetical protein
VAGGRTHIGTYVGVSPSPASNANNKIKKTQKIILCFFYFSFLKSYPVVELCDALSAHF